MHRCMQLHCSLSRQTAVSLTGGLSHGSRGREEGGVKEERFDASKKVSYSFKRKCCVSQIRCMP